MAITKSSKRDDNCNLKQLEKEMINEQHTPFLSSDVKSKCLPTLCSGMFKY